MRKTVFVAAIAAQLLLPGSARASDDLYADAALDRDGLAGMIDAIAATPSPEAKVKKAKAPAADAKREAAAKAARAPAEAVVVAEVRTRR
jgi:hypothetical protein